MSHDDRLDLCSIRRFAQMSGISLEQAIDMLDSGTIPGMKLAGMRMVNLARIRDDLDKGKIRFHVGDYSHD